MENFVFYSPTEFVFGRDTQAKVGELCRRHGARKVMIVSGSKSAEESGLLAIVRASLINEAIPFVEQKGIRPNPRDTEVYEGIELARREGVDFLLAVGGGSVIDSAKATALGVKYPGDFWDFYTGSALPKDGEVLPLGVVLTIPAAGSEGSGNSVITKQEGKHKISVRYPMHLRPRFAVMNPELTMTLPWFQTACGIADMLCHIYERYFSPTPADIPDALAEALMRRIMADALTLKGDPDNYEARASVMWASTLAHNGLCGTGKAEDWSSHALEHELSAWYNVSHGAGLAVIFPAWLEFVGSKVPGKVLQYARNVLDISLEGKTEEQVVREAAQAQREFYHTLGLATTIRELVNHETGQPLGESVDIPLLVRSLQGNKGASIGTYVPLSPTDAELIYTSAL